MENGNLQLWPKAILKNAFLKKTITVSQFLEGEPTTNTGKLTTIRKRVLSKEQTSRNENKTKKVTGNEMCPSITKITLV